jgi:hypothetical protein
LNQASPEYKAKVLPKYQHIGSDAALIMDTKECNIAKKKKKG